MASITMSGIRIRTCGDLPAPGSPAPDFRLVNSQLEDVSLAGWPGKKKLLSVVPSLDTPTCALSTKRFDREAARNEDSVFLIISADLPFAMKRFFQAENTEQVIALSMMRNQDFAHSYGLLIEDGPFAGILARAVLVLDADDRVVYTELVSELTSEPDYQSALDALAQAGGG